MGAQGQQPAAVMSRCPHPIIACDKREAFAQGSEATKQSMLSVRRQLDCFAELSSGAHSRDPLAHKDGGEIHDSSDNFPCRAALAEPQPARWCAPRIHIFSNDNAKFY
jgi:hypothetical protein